MPLFLIVGFSSRTKASGIGELHCPTCQTTRPFVELRQSRWISLFFIPLIPLGSSRHGRIQCTVCGSEFDEEILAAR